ncbi:hypothetical protein KKI24_28700 [bacterium]|nr:hypothetical protein [bacterium]
MKRNYWIILITIMIFGLAAQTVWADDLDELSELSDNQSTEQETAPVETGANELDLDAQAGDSIDSGGDTAELKISFGGYLKLLSYWNQEKYSDMLWGMYHPQNRPPAQDLNGFNNVGTRLQLKMEGYLGEHARLFTALNINYNIAGSIHETDELLTTKDKKSQQNAELRLVESFVEIYAGSRTWKVGPQLVTWSYLEGMEVPTDRVNARDSSYKSTEYEDSKLPSTGVLLTQKIADSRFEVMMIPIARTNISMEFQEYLYPADELRSKQKTDQAKWATRFSSTVGKLDYAISYVEGTDPNADLYVADVVVGQPLFGRTYNRIQSPGLDLQYNLGSVLAKLSYVSTITEDEAGDSRLIKNSWNKYVVGAEFPVGGSTVNIYAGQHTIDNYKTDQASQQTNFLLGQIRERTDFISGHVNANFLTGNALNLVLMAANYWDEEGEAVQTIVRGTFKYKIADGLEFLFGPSYMDMMDNRFIDVQTEVKYSF